MSRSKGDDTPPRNPREPRPTAWQDSGNGRRPDYFSMRHDIARQQRAIGAEGTDIYDLMDSNPELFARDTKKE